MKPIQPPPTASPVKVCGMTYLTFHYTGQPIEANNAPEMGTNMVGPGAEKISVKPIELSGDVASAGKPVTLTTTVTGNNVSYLYIFTGRLNKDQDHCKLWILITSIRKPPKKLMA